MRQARDDVTLVYTKNPSASRAEKPNNFNCRSAFKHSYLSGHRRKPRRSELGFTCGCPPTTARPPKISGANLKLSPGGPAGTWSRSSKTRARMPKARWLPASRSREAGCAVSVQQLCVSTPCRADASNLRCSTADRDNVEPALRMSEQRGSLDDAQFLDLAGLGALQHGEDGRCCVAHRIRCV